MDNSQMLCHAMMYAVRILTMLSATLTPRSAIHVTRKLIQLATLLPSVLLPVESHMLSATLELENAHHASKETRSALKSRKNVTKNAKFKKYQSATTILESVKCALVAELAASQLSPVKKHAHQVQYMLCTNAIGNLLTQLAWRTQWQQ